MYLVSRDTKYFKGRGGRPIVRHYAIPSMYLVSRDKMCQ